MKKMRIPAILLSILIVFGLLILTSLPLTSFAAGTDITEGGTASDNGAANPGGEDETMAFDNSASTKWLVYSVTGIIQYTFAGTQTYAVNSYTVTSGNDYPGRDPKNWTFQGSNDGNTWTTLDTRTNVAYTNRLEVQTFTFTNTIAYHMYRLNITANSGENMLQISEIQMFAGSGATPTPTPTATPTATPTPTSGATPTPAPDDISSHYTFNQVVTGGGGWGALVFESPASPGTLYFKDDVSSIYRFDSGATTWKKLNTWGSLPSGYVENSNNPGGPMLDCAANDANRVYMAWDRNLFYSNNKGDNWIKGNISTPINYMNGVEQGGTGGTQLRRLQRMAVDPNNKDVAYYGSNFDGLFRTTDGGQNWTKLSGGLYTGTTVDTNNNIGGYINTVFDKSGGTVSNPTRTAIVWATCRGQGVYRSTDGGTTWTKVANQPTGTIYYNDAAVNNAGTFFFASGSDNNDGKIYKCPRGSTTWTDITPFSSGAFETITVDPFSQKIWAQTSSFNHAFSSDEGATWSSFTWGSFNTIAKDCPWYSDTSGGLISVGKVRFSPNTQNKLLIGYGNGGVMYTTNPYATNNVLDVTRMGKGLQDFCLSKVLATNTNKLQLALWEEAGFTYDTSNLTTPPTQSWKEAAGLNDGWGLKEGENVAACESNQNALVATVESFESTAAQNIRSTDGGATWTNITGDDNMYLVSGNVAIARNNPLNFLIGEITDTFYWYGTPQYLPQNRPLHVTTNGGSSFTTANGSNSIHMWGGPIWASNAQNLCADPNVDNRFLAWSNDDEYVYASTDGGQNFTPINTSRPWASENGVWAKIFGIPGKTGHFIFCQGAGGTTNAPLWKTTDGGVTWSNINTNLTNVVMAGVGKTLTGANYPTLYVYGTYNSDKGFYRSSDGGTTWQKIAGKYLPNDYIFENVKDIEGDKNVEGKVYMILGNNSLVYGVYN